MEKCFSNQIELARNGFLMANTKLFIRKESKGYSIAGFCGQCGFCSIPSHHQDIESDIKIVCSVCGGLSGYHLANIQDTKNKIDDKVRFQKTGAMRV